MSIYIQEVLGLLKRNKKKIALDKDRDFFEFGKLATTSRINTSSSYIAQMEPFTIKYGDFYCDLLKDVVLQNGATTTNYLPMYAPLSGTCATQNTSIENSVAKQILVGGLTSISIDGGLIVSKDAVLKEKIELGTSGDVVNGTSLFNRVLDSAGAEAGAANRILRSLADGRVVWSDDDPVMSLTQGSIWIGSAAGVKEELAIGANAQILVSNGTTAVWQAQVIPVDGTGTANNIAMWSDSDTLTDAAPISMVQSGSGATSLLTVGSESEQTVTFESSINLQAGVKDSTSSLGTAGMILYTTGTTVKWTSNMVAGLNFNDDVKLTFGDPGVPGDLEIFHNAANSVIKDTGTGNLVIQGSNVILQSSLTKNSIICGDSDSVDIFYNGALKLQTANTGIKITGGILDVNDQLGTAGQVLSSTGTTLDWIDAVAGTISGVTAGTDLAGGGSSGSVTLNNSSTLATVTARGASTTVASTFSGGLTSSGVLNVSGSGANGYLYVTGNAGNPSVTNPTHAQGFAFAYNNSGGSRECEVFWNTGTTTVATNNASYLGFYNEFLNSDAGNARVTDTQLKLYGTGELELVGNTPTVSNPYWRMPTVAAPNTGYVLAKKNGSIDLEWVPNANIYTVYTALLTQSGTAAPVATVLENTTGATIAWTRTGSGVYVGTISSALFAANKTVVFVNTGGGGTAAKWTRTSTTALSVDSTTDGIFIAGSLEIRIYP